MLRIINFEEIHNSLNEVPEFVDLYDKKDIYFSVKVKDWLQSIEKILENNRLIIAGRIAGLRALLISAEQGIIPEKIRFNGQPSKKKILNATASSVLLEANQIISDYLQNDIQRFAEAERQIRQLLVYFQAKDKDHKFMIDSFDTETLKNIWQTIKTDPNLTQGAVNVESLVDFSDSLIILNRVLTSLQQH